MRSKNPGFPARHRTGSWRNYRSRLDGSITPFVLAHGRWQTEELEFIRTRSNVVHSADRHWVKHRTCHEAIDASVVEHCGSRVLQIAPRNCRLLTYRRHLPQCHLIHSVIGVVPERPGQFWSSVQADVMEIWRINCPLFDCNRLAAILGAFNVRRFGDEPWRNLAVEEIPRFLDGTDYRHRDLLFARA